MILLSGTASAQGAGNFGAGFVLGAPTGLSFALGNVQLTVAYSFLDSGSLLVVGDYKVLNQAITGEVKNLNWYLGPGMALEVFFTGADAPPKGRADKSNLWLGAHVIVGASWVFVPRWELFLELGPGVYLFPAVNFLGTGGLGIRFYF